MSGGIFSGSGWSVSLWWLMFFPTGTGKSTCQCCQPGMSSSGGSFLVIPSCLLKCIDLGLSDHKVSVPEHLSWDCAAQSGGHEAESENCLWVVSWIIVDGWMTHTRSVTFTYIWALPFRSLSLPSSYFHKCSRFVDTSVSGPSLPSTFYQICYNYIWALPFRSLSLRMDGGIDG